MNPTTSEATIARHLHPAADAVDDCVDGFDAFVAARWSLLWRSAWLLTGDAQKAEDLVQTALGKCWPHFDRVNANGSFDAYVRRTLLTTYLAWWRKRSWTERPTELSDRVVAEPDIADRVDLLAALARLPRGQRAVLVLRYFEDRTEVEAAQLLGCSLGTIKSQHARAIKALRTSGLVEGEVRP